MKKITIFVLLVVFGLSLTSCGIFANKTQINSDKNKDSYDEVLLSGDGYEIVAKWVESLEKSEYYIGVIKDGDWLYPLSTDNIFLRSSIFDHKTSGLRNTANVDKFHYCDDGIFQIENYFYDVYNNTGFSLDDVDYYINKPENIYLNFIDDYTITSGYRKNDSKDNTTLLRIKRDGTVTNLNIPGIARRYKEGLCYSNGKFYDANGQAVIDVSDLASKFNLLGSKQNYGNRLASYTDAPYFYNGKCTILVQNDGGSVYAIEIDKNGNRQPEKKVENPSGLISYK